MNKAAKRISKTIFEKETFSLHSREIIELIEEFNRNTKRYKPGNYNEADIRLEFIDPFFKALGWDLTNRLCYSEDYKDVVRE